MTFLSLTAGRAITRWEPRSPIVVHGPDRTYEDANATVLHGATRIGSDLFTMTEPMAILVCKPRYNLWLVLDSVKGHSLSSSLIDQNYAPLGCPAVGGTGEVARSTYSLRCREQVSSSRAQWSDLSGIVAPSTATSFSVAVSGSSYVYQSGGVSSSATGTVGTSALGYSRLMPDVGMVLGGWRQLFGQAPSPTQFLNLQRSALVWANGGWSTSFSLNSDAMFYYGWETRSASKSGSWRTSFPSAAGMICRYNSVQAIASSGSLSPSGWTFYAAGNASDPGYQYDSNVALVVHGVVGAQFQVRLGGPT